MTNIKYFAVPALALGALTMASAPAMAQEGEHWSFSTTLESLNNSGATGDASVDLHGNGNEATVKVNVSGAAETFMDGPFPHAQHIHTPEQGAAECPTAASDTNGDGVIDTPEGQPAYGPIATSLTTEGDTSPESALAVDRFPGGSSYNYERTLELDAETAAAVKNGTAVVVTHGVDPTLLPAAAAEAMSPLDESLPLAATLPATCGVLTASQMDAMPEGGADTGVAQETGFTSMNAALAGGGVLAAAGAAFALRRRAASTR